MTFDEAAKLRQPAKTVADLIRVLQTMPPDAPVEGFWESQGYSIMDVVLNDDGTVLLDVDGGWLRHAMIQQKEQAS